MVRVQMLAELEEIVAYKQSEKEPEKREAIRKTWIKRLLGCQQNVEVWHRILKLRSAVISPQEDLETWIKFANLCRKNGRHSLSERTLANLVGVEHIDGIDVTSINPQIAYAYLKHIWATGSREEALLELKSLNTRLSMGLQAASKAGDSTSELMKLLSRSYLKQGKWLSVMNEDWNEACRILIY
jgi:FKBP12-rapamycin complex-associated protein